MLSTFIRTESTLKFFFQRGIQSLQLNKNQPTNFQGDINFLLNDTEKYVRQLSAAMSSSTVNFFLTLTCNQKKHPSVAPLLKAIALCYSDSIEEIRRNAVPSYLSTIVRCWSRSVQYLITLLKKKTQRKTS